MSPRMSSWHMPEHVTGSHAGDTLSSSLNDSYLSSYFTRSATLSNDVQQVGANFADCFLQKCFYICRLKWLALFSYFLLSVCVWYCHHRLTVHYCIYVSSSVSVGLTPLMSTSLIASTKSAIKGMGCFPCNGLCCLCKILFVEIIRTALCCIAYHSCT